VSGDIVERLRLLGSIDCPYGCDEEGHPAANNLRALASDAPDLAASYAVTIAADLLDAIDAHVAAYMNDSIDSSAAIQAISRLLHPKGGPS
jgi:hypothetical protein